MNESRAIVTAMLRSLAVIVACWMPVGAKAAPLRMFFVDVEGGQATLLVGPTGQSLLIDAGWPGFDGRDAARIVSAAKAAGISRIDFLLVTHYHSDHVGGVPQLAQQMEIGTYLDHGPNREDSDDTRANYAAYEKVGKGAKRILVKPGDRVPVDGLDITVVSSDGEHITEPLPGAGERNPLCASEPAPPDDATENARSVGVMITFGKLRLLDLGDLSKKYELALACPKNLLGTVDLFVVTHHGAAQSNARALVHVVRPRVAIMDNGARKGGNPDVWDTIHQSQGLADVWQLHHAIEGGKEHNASPDWIANPEEKCEGKRIDVVADQDGTITVTNTRNGFTKTYKK